MNWKEFTASVIGDVLSWPVIVFLIVLLVLKPLRKLIGRVKGAKGFGGEVEFGELLENAEESVDRAWAEASESQQAKNQRTLGSGNESNGEESEQPLGATAKDPGGDSSVPQFAVDPGVNPSGAILESWETLVGTLSSLSRLKAGRGRPAQTPRAVLSQLKRSDLVSDSFADAVDSLHKMRNQVAHGEADPTRGVATTYVKQARELDAIAKSTMNVEDMKIEGGGSQLGSPS